MTASLRRFVKARTTVSGVHCWPGAPDPYRVLRAPHRHQFTFEVEFDVTEPDRQVEFIYAAAAIQRAVIARFPPTTDAWIVTDFGSLSCEMLAELVLEEFPGAVRCTVWEDMENAGGAERRP